ncbi:hypothetical protein [Streptomyces mirabilis]|uniref:hypothetical protein n=1 Tax=Streptomyces mirabilis TaxID=68239 RepID=UPI0036C020D7
MRLRRRKAEPRRAPRPNYMAIAVLEHALFGIQPEPGTAAALTIALRQVGACMTHRPVETTTLGQLPQALCTRCGKSMIQGDDGTWEMA